MHQTTIKDMSISYANEGENNLSLPGCKLRVSQQAIERLPDFWHGVFQLRSERNRAFGSLLDIQNANGWKRLLFLITGDIRVFYRNCDPADISNRRSS